MTPTPKQNNADGFEGQLSLFMKNGATWINEAYGMTPEGFKGSKVYYLQGGKSKEEAGVIFQKDETRSVSRPRREHETDLCA